MRKLVKNTLLISHAKPTQVWLLVLLLLFNIKKIFSILINFQFFFIIKVMRKKKNAIGVKYY